MIDYKLKQLINKLKILLKLKNLDKQYIINYIENRGKICGYSLQFYNYIIDEQYDLFNIVIFNDNYKVYCADEIHYYIDKFIKNNNINIIEKYNTFDDLSFYIEINNFKLLKELIMIVYGVILNE